jgi:hypothetical protein
VPSREIPIFFCLAPLPIVGDHAAMSEPDSPWRPEFLDALRMLARVSEALARRGLPRPVLSLPRT